MWDLNETIDYYRSQGAPGDQQMLIALLREAQQAAGPLTAQTVSAIEQALKIPPSTIPALIKRVPSIRMAAHPHRLEICQNCGRQLALWVQENCHVSPGGVCGEGGFSFHLTGCMKNCKASPSMKWDGVLYPRASVETLKGILKVNL